MSKISNPQHVFYMKNAREKEKRQRGRSRQKSERQVWMELSGMEPFSSCLATVQRTKANHRVQRLKYNGRKVSVADKKKNVMRRA